VLFTTDGVRHPPVSTDSKGDAYEALRVLGVEKKNIHFLGMKTQRSEEYVLRDYTERLLSTHPLYASVLILLNLGGVLDLPTLAMSVGAHPLKLRQMLEDLVTKGLITISNDDPPTIAAVMV